MAPSTPFRTALAFAAMLVATVSVAQEPPKEYSAAERAIFMADQLGKLRAPATLRYSFRHAGSLEAPFDDTVSIALKPHGDGSCCEAAGTFLSGERRIVLPSIESASANPVTLFFLERDIGEMQRLTTGKSAYFRKRIRMAIFQSAEQRSVTMRYLGKTVAGTEYTITPYVDDPNRPRFERFANKRYVFTLSDAVPGGVYGIRALVTAEGAAPDGAAAPLLADELLMDGASFASIKAAS